MVENSMSEEFESGVKGFGGFLSPGKCWIFGDTIYVYIPLFSNIILYLLTSAFQFHLALLRW